MSSLPTTAPTMDQIVTLLQTEIHERRQPTLVLPRSFDLKAEQLFVLSSKQQPVQTNIMNVYACLCDTDTSVSDQLVAMPFNSLSQNPTPQHYEIFVDLVDLILSLPISKVREQQRCERAINFVRTVERLSNPNSHSSLKYVSHPFSQDVRLAVSLRFFPGVPSSICAVPVVRTRMINPILQWVDWFKHMDASFDVVQYSDFFHWSVLSSNDLVLPVLENSIVRREFQLAHHPEGSTSNSDQVIVRLSIPLPPSYVITLSDIRCCTRLNQTNLVCFLDRQTKQPMLQSLEGTTIVFNQNMLSQETPILLYCRLGSPGTIVLA